VETIRQYQAAACVPAIMSDTHQWLTTHLIHESEWTLLRNIPGATTATYTKPETIVPSGERLLELCIIDKGKVSVFAKMGKQVSIPLLEHTEGTLVGLESWLRDPKYPHEVREKETVVFCC
jgi:signal-transduction protein with cAMP-binding, CBS, and nucleotidyltransferase domain